MTQNILSLRDKILNKELKVIDIIKYYSNKIKEQNEKTNALISIHENTAMQEAKIWDQRIQDNNELDLEKFPLLGIPIVIKDNINVKSLEVRSASKILKSYIASFDATVIERLRKAGAIILAQSNCDEMAMGSANKTSVYGPVHNPQNFEYVSGGSSGGSAAAVASKMIPLALGSDTGGSIRQPAAWCGTLGIKPTYGRVSRYGLHAYASSLDVIGGFANYVDDLWLFLKVIEGYDPKDLNTQRSFKALNPLKKKNYTQNLKIAFLKDKNTHLMPHYQKAFDELELWLKKQNAQIQEVEIPQITLCPIVYAILAFSEAASNFARYSGFYYGYRDLEAKNLENMIMNTRTKGFGLEVKKRVLLGNFFLLKDYYHYYLKAQNIRLQIKNAYQEIFKKVDIILAPSSFKSAFKIEDSLLPEESYCIDQLTIGQNFSGIPALSIPFLKDKENHNLPLGLHITANHFREDKLLEFAYQLEQEFLKP